MDRGDNIQEILAGDGITPETFRTRDDDRLKLDEESRRAVRQLTRRHARSGKLSSESYNLTISHQHRFMWFRVAKVGTRTILGHFHEHRVPIEVEHAMRMPYPTVLFDDYFKFAFVRHPLGRFVSAWQNKVVDHNYFGFDQPTHTRMQTVTNFAEWVATQDLSDLSRTDHHLALQSRLIDLNNLDHLGRLETFDDDFADVCRRIGVPASPARPRNQTKPGSVSRADVSADLTAIIRDIYRRDFQIFGYS